jgi:hypothetical protein
MAEYEDVSFAEHVAHWTFWPMVVIVFSLPLSVIPLLFVTGTIGIGLALTLPWLSVLIASAWVSVLGEYVLPASTYYRRIGWK